MRALSGSTRSNSISETSIKNSNFEPVVGWDSDEKQEISEPDKRKKIIALANSKVSLFDTLRRYSVHLENTYSSNNWSFRARCPFDDHNDKTPSFGYNPEIDLFNCLGCHRSGRSVEFIAIKEGKDALTIAKQILSHLDIDETSGFENTLFDFKELQNILFSHAERILEFKKVNNNSLKAINYAKNLSWSVDVFLRKNSDFNMNIDNLKMIIKNVEEQLDLFEDLK